MYNDEIKKILKNTYQVRAHTLDYGSTMVRGNKLYFYTLDNDYEKKIVSVRNALDNQLSSDEIRCLLELKQSFLYNSKWELPQCACYTENHDTWTLTFHYIKGVRYHKTYGQHVAATLILQNAPIIELSSKKEATLFGYWDKTAYDYIEHRKSPQTITEGINYRANRNLLSNSIFRSFTADFFLAIADVEEKYILKDISRTIKQWGYYLPSISLSSTLSSHAPAEMLEPIVSKSEKLNINFNKTDMNLGYAIAKLSPFIHKRDRHTLRKMTPETLKKCISLKNIFDGLNSSESIEQFVMNYFRFERGFSVSNVYDFVKDYVHMSLEHKVPIHLSISFKKLKRKHDELMELTRKKEYLAAEQNASLITKPSKFDSLEEALNRLFPNELQRIHTLEQLLLEGEFQHNCVFSRRDLIRKDRVAIFHWYFENESYTVQFAVNPWGNYYIDEIQAKFNQKCSTPAMKKLKQMLADVNTDDLIDITPYMIYD